LHQTTIIRKRHSKISLSVQETSERIGLEKKKEEKRQRKLENNTFETDETEKDTTPSTVDR
jgi:hypothetical protein